VLQDDSERGAWPATTWRWREGDEEPAGDPTDGPCLQETISSGLEKKFLSGDSQLPWPSALTLLGPTGPLCQSLTKGHLPDFTMNAQGEGRLQGRLRPDHGTAHALSLQRGVEDVGGVKLIS